VLWKKAEVCGMLSVRRLRIAVLLACLCPLLLRPPVPVQADGDAGVSMHVEAGFDGNARFGRWIPVVVEVGNTGADLQGDLVAREMRESSGTSGQPATDQPYQTAYSLAVTLPRNSRKRLTLDIPIRTRTDGVRVELVAQGRTIAAETAPVSLLSNQQALIGVVSDTTVTLPSLRQTVLPRGAGQRPVQVVDVPTLLFPLHADELAVFDALVFENASTKKLSTAQVTALEGWVSDGGMLILSGGVTWPLTAAGLPASLLAVTTPETRTVTDMSALGRVVGAAGPAGQPAVVSVGTAVTGSPLAVQDGVSLLVLLQRGKGSVLFSALDVAAEPLLSWPGMPSLWRYLLVLGLAPAAVQTTGMPAGFAGEAFGNMAIALGNLPALDPPSLRVTGALLALYIVLVGPLNFLILRRLHRQALGWVTMPLLALGFTVVTYGLAFHEKGSTAIVNSVVVTEQPVAAGVAHVSSFVGLFAPTEQDYHVRFREPGLASSVMPPAYMKGPPGNAVPTLGLLVHQSATPEVDLVQLPQWSMRGVMSSRWTPAAPVVEGRLTIVADAIEGTVTNRSDRVLDDAAVVGPWGAQRLGRLAPGESMHVRLSQGDGAYVSLPQVYSSVDGEDDPSQPLWRTRQLRQQIVSAMWPGTMLASGPSLGPVSFVGWTTPVEAPVTVDGHAVPASGVEVVAVGLAVNSSAAGDLPPGIVAVRLAGAEGAVQAQGSALSLGQGAITYLAHIPAEAPAVHRLAVHIVLLPSASPPDLSIALFNHNSGSYDDLTVATAPIVVNPKGSRQSAPPGPMIAVPAPPAGPGGMVAGKGGYGADAVLERGDMSNYLGPDGTVRVRVSKSTASAVVLGWVGVGYGGSGGQ